MLVKNFGGRKNDRRIEALVRLKVQQAVGRKPLSVKQALRGEEHNLETNGGVVTQEMSDKDFKRIEKEIAILHSRIVAPEVAAARRTKKYRGGMGTR